MYSFWHKPFSSNFGRLGFARTCWFRALCLVSNRIGYAKKKFQACNARYVSVCAVFGISHFFELCGFVLVQFGFAHFDGCALLCTSRVKSRSYWKLGTRAKPSRPKFEKMVYAKSSTYRHIPCTAGLHIPCRRGTSLWHSPSYGN